MRTDSSQTEKSGPDLSSNGVRGGRVPCRAGRHLHRAAGDRLSTALTRGSASRDRIAELLRLPVLQPHPVGPPPTRAVRPRQGKTARPGLAISLDRVSYAHRPGELVLDNVSLDSAQAS